jgi:hypothetical protein
MQDLRDLQNSYIQELKKCHVPQVPHYKTACGRKMTNEMYDPENRCAQGVSEK